MGFLLKNKGLILFILVSYSYSFGQTTIWSEDFESYANGITNGAGTGTSTATWSTNNGNIDVRTSSGNKVLRGSNTSTNARWITNAIDISGYSNVTFSLDANSGGGLDSGTDVFRIQYRIDGGSYIQIENTSGDTSPSEPIQPSYSVSGLSGSTLELRITMYNTTGAEFYDIDNILVQGNTSSPGCSIVSSTPGSFIADNSTLNSTINGFTSGTITDVNITLDITHTWDSDLTISLISPEGTIVVLSSNNGGSGNNYTNTVFDDAGVTNITSGSAPFTSTFRPEGNLSDFNSENPNGSWTLRVFDGAGGDTGTLNSFSIEVCTAAATPDLAVSKTVNNNTPSEGSNIIYTLRVVNNGPDNATNVSLTDILPSGVSFVSDDGGYNSGTGVWTIGALNNGNTATLNITVSIDGSTSGSTITNTITSVTADQTDSNITADDLSESITPTLNQPPEVTVTGDQQYCPGTSQAIAETISITDHDDTTTDAIFIQISSGYISGEDVLTLTGTHPNITASFDVTEGELTLLGPTTYTEFEAAILAVEFSSSAGSPSGTRQFSITPGSANYLPPTDHYYEFVASVGITWTAARDAAALRTYYGLQGYLATLTTQDEADFSGSQSQGVGWIGASDATTEGDWRWVTGPETGTSFWSGGIGGNVVAPYNFAFWNSNEPNQSGNEDYAHITHPNVNPNGSWNDLSNTGAASGNYQPQGYVVEYGGTVGDPVLSITGVTMLTVDNENPTASNPSPVTVYCSGDVPSSDVTVVIDEADNCTTNPVVTFIGDSSNGGSNPEIIMRTYRIADDSGNFIDVIQTITISPIMIDTQPSNQIVSVGSNGTFTSSTSNADTYQWQVSTNSGLSFSDISDGSDYSGTSTEVLLVLSPDIDKNGYIYRILVSNSLGSCPTITSNNATLNLQVTSVITNRRITYRVKKN